MLRIRIRDPGLVAFLTPGSGIRDGRKSASGSGIRDEQPGSYFLELRNHFFAFFGLKYLNSLMRIRDPGWRQFGSGIRDGKKSDPGSGINIPDPPHWYIHKGCGGWDTQPSVWGGGRGGGRQRKKFVDLFVNVYYRLNQNVIGVSFVPVPYVH